MRLKDAIKLADEGASLELCVYDGKDYIYISGRANIMKVLESPKHVMSELRKMIEKLLPLTHTNEEQATTSKKRTKRA